MRPPDCGAAEGCKRMLAITGTSSPPAAATMFTGVQVTAGLWLVSLLAASSSAYELQDTIHTLKEENLHLQHRLENLTRAVRDLKHLLTDYSRVSGGEHDPDYLHSWREWSQHGISAETHRALEQALCLTELRNAARSTFVSTGCLILSGLISTVHSPLS